MARVRMVTRTVEVTTVEVMGLNLSTMMPETVTLELGTLTDTNEEKILKVCQKLVDENLKLVKIVSLKEQEILYGMEEQDFIAHAKVLPPRGTKESDEN